MKILSSYKKIAKELIKEAAWDRKFGEPLPTLSSVMKEASDDDKVIGKNGKIYQTLILNDTEGNGPGFLEIETKGAE